MMRLDDKDAAFVQQVRDTHPLHGYWWAAGLLAIIDRLTRLGQEDVTMTDEDRDNAESINENYTPLSDADLELLRQQGGQK